MEILIPAFLVLHIFGFILWAGSALLQYVYLADLVDRGTPETRRFAMDLIGRLNKTFLNIGLTLVLLTGIGMIIFHGMDWFRPRLFVYAKIILAIIAAGFSHAGWGKYKKAFKLMENNPAAAGDDTQFRDFIKSWKTSLVITILLLGITVITAIFRFGA
jgi:hypothetical protein